MAPSTELLTVREVALRLNLSTQTVYVYIKRGLLSSVRLSARTLRIPVESVEAFLEKGYKEAER